jgi:ribosomal protein S27AE
MAVAKKMKNDEPPLKKSTITKAHDIAKSIMKKEEVCPKCGKDHANKINASNCGGMRETKTFSQLRTETKVIKLGDKGKTVTGKQAAAVDVEPSTKPI